MARKNQATSPVWRSMLKSKIHRATVTHADVDYEGSVTVDSLLLEAADILPGEEVDIWNVTRGTRLRTYAMTGQTSSGIVCINGAAAHLMRPGDLVIIATFVHVENSKASAHRPTVILVDSDNRIRNSHAIELPGPQRREPFPSSNPAE